MLHKGIGEKNVLLNMLQSFVRRKILKWPSDSNDQTGFEKQDIMMSRIGLVELKGKRIVARKVSKNFT